MRTLKSEVSLKAENGVLVYSTPYNPGLVAALKAQIPTSDRRWDPARKVWLVSTTHGHTLAELAMQYLGTAVTVPFALLVGDPEPETRILNVRYIGLTKDRGDGQWSAFGWQDGEWSVIFPEPVLRQWFNAETQPDRPEQAPTLYATLGLPRAADGPQVKSAYRRMALQWHPDRCHEPDAAEVFIRIQHAYEVLNNTDMRARYDAGLALEASVRQQRERASWLTAAQRSTSYRSPLRCGLIMATGVETLGRFAIAEIHAWEDVTDSVGHVLVTSWPAGADTFLEEWL